MTILTDAILSIIDLMMCGYADELMDGTPCLCFADDCEADEVVAEFNKNLDGLTVFDNFRGGSFVVSADKTIVALVLFIEDTDGGISVCHKIFAISY